VRDGEDYVLDTVLRVPLETAGFRYQRFHPFALGGNHLYAWIEGAPYSGDRPHRAVPLSFTSAEEAAERVGDPVLATAIQAAARSYRSQDEQAFHADNQRTLEPAYLCDTSPQQGSGFGGDAGEWRQARWHLTEAIAGDGTFLDVGCANGLLMESVAAWCAECGLAVEPYGVDISPALAERARQRLPRWAGRIWAGNAADWRPPHGQRFDYVHILLDCVPRAGRADLIRHHLAHTVRPGSGRLLVSDYAADPAAGTPAGPRDGHGPRLPLRRADQRRRPAGPGAQPDRMDHGWRMIRPAMPPAAFAPKASAARASGYTAPTWGRSCPSSTRRASSVS
jgi:SAM-dependent methyltransferase